jgi:hypothetical protein
MTDNNTRDENKKENTSAKPDRDTMHTPDPQENMKGPVSSTMHNAGKAFETDETKEEADDEKDRKL